MVQPDMEVLEPRITVTATCPKCNKGVAYLNKTYVNYNGMWARMEHHLYCPECQMRRYLVTTQHRQYLEAVRHVYQDARNQDTRLQETEKEAENVQTSLAV